MVLNGPYAKIKSRKDRLQNLGYQYQGRILKNALSGHIVAKNGMFKSYLDKLDDIYTEMVEQIKYIKMFVCFAADKNERRIN